MQRRGIGIIGLGTVGGSVLEQLRTRKEALERRGAPYEVVGVAVRDRTRARPGVEPALFTTPEALATHPGVDVLVELAGGVEQPWEWVRAALEAGKSVVTANKALVAERAVELAGVLAKCSGTLHIEAAVAGGIPIIQAVDRGLVANEVRRIEGTLNGTCNYLLTSMERDGLDMEVALKTAQELGFAEADPTLDVGGGDAAHKLAILASLVLGRPIPSTGIFTQGIRNLTAFDVTWAREHGYRIKLLAIAQVEGAEVELRVHPTLVRTTRLISQVMDEFNAVEVEGDLTGPQLYYGRGAGAEPTASAVLSDIVHAPGGEGPVRRNDTRGRDLRLRPMGEVVSRHYLHLEVIDRPGVVEGVARALASQDISIASLYQPETDHGAQVPLVFTTHPAADAQLSRALETIRQAPYLATPPVHIRLED